MKLVFEKTPDLPPSAEGSIAEKPSALSKPQLENSVAWPKQSILPSMEDGLLEGLFSNDLHVVDDVNEELPEMPGRNDRKSCRYIVPQAQQSCELKVGTDVLSAMLVDRSEGGFSVLVDRLDGLKIGKKVELHANTEYFTVRITYINEIASPTNAASKGKSWFRLGMKKKKARKSFPFF